MDDAIRQSVLNKLPAAGIAIPFVLAVLAQLAGPKPGPVAAGPTPPALAFHQYLVDLGQATATENVLAHFDFSNHGTNDVEITDLVASCGCLQPHMKKKAYKPGESGFFSLTIQTANQSPGQKEYTVTVKYSDPQPQEALVVFRVVLPDDQVSVRPRALAFYQIGDSQRDDELASLGIEPQDFEITDRRSRHLNIRRVECSRDEVEVELRNDELDATGTWHGRFRVRIEGPLAPGHREAVVRIFTDDPDDRYRVLRVPLILERLSQRKRIDPHVRQVSGTKPVGRTDK